MNALNTLVHLGPLNGGVLATFLVLVLGAVAVSLHRVHRGEPVPVLPLTVVLLLPLLFSTWASTWQYDHALTYTVDVPNPEKQRFIADMLSRVLATQVWSGAIAALGAVGLLGGSLAAALCQLVQQSVSLHTDLLAIFVAVGIVSQVIFLTNVENIQHGHS